MPLHFFTKEHDAWLKENQFGISRKELTNRFNQKFGTNKSIRLITSHCQYLGLKNGFTGRFDGTQKCWQKGLSKEDFKSHYTKETYNKMLKSILNKRKYNIGDFIFKDGVCYIVVSIKKNTAQWKRIVPYARYLWEKNYGFDEENKNFCFVFADGNYKNTDISNVLKITRHDTMKINVNGYKGCGEITKAYLDVLEVERVIKKII